MWGELYELIFTPETSARSKETNMRALVKVTVALCVLASAAAAQTGAPAAWTPELQIKVRAIATPRVSPDGRRVVYTVSDAVTTPERSEYVSQIWMATADGRENFQLTFADKSSTNPKWSPDGNWIAFTSNRKENKNNLYLLRANGGTTALTRLPSGRRASTIGLDSSMRRPAVATMRWMMRLRCVSSVKR